MKQNDYDTIFASSSQFKSAIKIIRISGKNAKKISNIFNFKRPKPRTFVLRKLIYKNNVIEWPIYNFREVPAELKLDNEKKIRISIRLKGDRPIHYIQKDNFSYKIKILTCLEACFRG